jgi:16S rRNA (cytidine1402-2'-O)-methyltransferase
MELTILGLPLGNIEDISRRAIDTLINANTILCEDTRVFGKLWQKLANMELVPKEHLKKLVVLNDFNEKTNYKHVFDQVRNDESVVLVSDAGMPLISDPGYKIVNIAIKEGVKVSVVPGPTALTTALSISGLPSDKFIFQGFLPGKPGNRKKTLQDLINLSDQYTIIIYESPYRITSLVEDLAPHDVNVVLARELTKQYETVLRFKSGEAPKITPRGEYVVLFRKL